MSGEVLEISIFEGEQRHVVMDATSRNPHVRSWAWSSSSLSVACEPASEFRDVRVEWDVWLCIGPRVESGRDVIPTFALGPTFGSSATVTNLNRAWLPMRIHGQPPIINAVVDLIAKEPAKAETRLEITGDTHGALTFVAPRGHIGTEAEPQIHVDAHRQGAHRLRQHDREITRRQSRPQPMNVAISNGSAE